MTLPTNGVFNQLVNNGFYIIANPDGSAAFRARPDNPNPNPAILPNYNLFDRSPGSFLAKMVAARDPNVVNTWIGLPVLTPAGRGILTAVDLSVGFPTSGYATVTMADLNGTQRIFKCSEISISFQ